MSRVSDILKLVKEIGEEEIKTKNSLLKQKEPEKAKEEILKFRKRKEEIVNQIAERTVDNPSLPEYKECCKKISKIVDSCHNIY